MSESTTNRVHYYKGQFLLTSDFQDEQEYHNGMRYRHNIGHHQWGIVAGLEIIIDDDDGLPYLQPGLAIDGFGRELVLPETRPLPTDRFDLEMSDTLDVWIYYLATTGSQNGATSPRCDPSGTSAAARWQENPRLWLEDPLDEGADRRKPPLLDDGLFNFGPQMSPASVDEGWPVFLGQISRDRSQSPVIYSCDLDDRPYAGAVAATLESPQDQTRIQLGASGKDDPRRFAVLPPGSSDPPLELTAEKDANGKEVYTWHLQGPTRIQETLTIDGGALQFEAGAACENKPSPWSIYQCAGEEATTDGRQPFKALRLEIPHGGSGANRLAIGAWKALPGQDPAFHSILTVAEDGQITVNGNLLVNGSAVINRSKFTEEALDQLRSRYFSFSSPQNFLSLVNYAVTPRGQQAFGLETLGLRATTRATVAPDPNFLPALEALELGPPLDVDVVLHTPFASPRRGWNNMLEGAQYQTAAAAATANVICMHDDSTVTFIGRTPEQGLHVKTEFELEGIKFVVWHCHLDESAGVNVDLEDTLQRGDLIGAVSSTTTGEVLVHVNLEVPGHGLHGFAVPDVVNPAPYVALQESA